MKKILFLFLVIFVNFAFATVSGHNVRFTKAQVEKDIDAQNMSKYRDHFEVLDEQALSDKNVFKVSVDKAIRDNIEITSAADFANNIDCTKNLNLEKWTASVYDVKPVSGVVTCLLAPQGDLYNPIGVFTISYPKAATFFAKDIKSAKADKSNEVAEALINFDTVYATIQEHQEDLDVLHENENVYLSVPALYLNTLLTNTDLVDVEATRDLGKLSFKQGVVVSEKAQKIGVPDAETFFNVYSGLSDVSMTYFVVLIGFFMLYGLGSQYLPAFTDSFEKQKSNISKHSHYWFGVIVGAILFLPYTTYDLPYDAIPNSENGKVLGYYDIMNTKWQDFERAGYNTFIDWADDTAKVVIDAEMQAIINKSGIGTANQIVQTYAGKVQFRKLMQFDQIFYESCKNGYNTSEMTMSSDGTKYRYSNNSQTPFTTNEDYAYAMALHDGSDWYYYRDLPKQSFYTQETNAAYSNFMSNSSDGVQDEGHYYYPKYTLAACGKAYFNWDFNSKRFSDYDKTLSSLEGTQGNQTAKLNAINTIVQLQYDLYNDWGFLSVLGLPITKMQTEMIGGIYESGESDYIKELNKAISKAGENDSSNPDDNDDWLKSFFSSIPYLFIPGAGTVFQVVSENSGKFGASIGTAAAGAGSGGILSVLGGAIGGIVGTISGGAIGLTMAYMVAKNILILAPIIGIILLGILRFIIIMIKVFTLHFAALFLLPVAFAKENIDAIAKFTMKVFATMLEIPLFVIGVWLAIMANGLIKTLGGAISKELVLGAINNENSGSAAVDTSQFGFADYFGNITGISHWMSIMKLYVFDGFMEIAIAVFSIVLIYKIIITFHTMILETIEVQGTRALDDSIESMRNESSGWGAKI